MVVVPVVVRSRKDLRRLAPSLLLYKEKPSNRIKICPILCQTTSDTAVMMSCHIHDGMLECQGVSMYITGRALSHHIKRLYSRIPLLLDLTIAGCRNWNRSTGTIDRTWHIA